MSNSSARQLDEPSFDASFVMDEVDVDHADVELSFLALGIRLRSVSQRGRMRS